MGGVLELEMVSYTKDLHSNSLLFKFLFMHRRKKICPSTPLSLGLIVHESFILPSKEEGIMSKKRQKM